MQAGLVEVAEGLDIIRSVVELARKVEAAESLVGLVDHDDVLADARALAQHKQDVLALQRACGAARTPLSEWDAPTRPGAALHVCPMPAQARRTTEGVCAAARLSVVPPVKHACPWDHRARAPVPQGQTTFLP